MSRKRRRRKEQTIEPSGMSSVVLRGLQSLDDDRRRAWLRRGAVAALLLGLCVGVHAGLQHLAEYVRALPAYAAPWHVRYVGMPPWMEPLKLAEHVNRSLGSLAGRPLLDADLAADIAEALGQDPWVKRVVRVEKHFGGVIEVECEYRRPIARIDLGGRTVWVDEQGVRLPVLADADIALFQIEGIRSPVPEVGHRWEGRDLNAAVELAALLQGEPFAEWIRALNVRNYGGRVSSRQPQIELRAVNGCRLIWGSAPGEEVVEPQAYQKLDLLRELHKKHGLAQLRVARINLTKPPDRIGLIGSETLGLTARAP